MHLSKCRLGAGKKPNQCIRVALLLLQSMKYRTSIYQCHIILALVSARMNGVRALQLRRSLALNRIDALLLPSPQVAKRAAITAAPKFLDDRYGPRVIRPNLKHA
jgi:hypothetical protein